MTENMKKKITVARKITFKVRELNCGQLKIIIMNKKIRLELNCL
jgi:hypothetical protein